MTHIEIGSSGGRSGSANLIHQNDDFSVSKGALGGYRQEPIPWIGVTWHGTRFDVYCNLKQHQTAVRLAEKQQWARLLKWCIGHTSLADVLRILREAREAGIQEGSSRADGTSGLRCSGMRVDPLTALRGGMSSCS